MSYALDIIRAFELSWLDNNGKPNIGILELSTNDMSPIDTMALKGFLETLNNTKFEDLNAVREYLLLFCDLEPNFNHYKCKIIGTKDFNSLNIFELTDLQQFYAHSITTQQCRFICSTTKQPNIGTINFLSNNSSQEMIKMLKEKIITLRNLAFTPQKFVDDLLSFIKEYSNEFILSLHLHRRGGISHQILRSPSVSDLRFFALRSILE